MCISIFNYCAEIWIIHDAFQITAVSRKNRFFADETGQTDNRIIIVRVPI